MDVENVPDAHRQHLSSILDAHASIEKEDILEVLKSLDFLSFTDIPPHHLLRVVETMDMERFETEFSDKTWVYKEVMEFRKWVKTTPHSQKCASAAEKNRFEWLKWARAHKYPWDYQTCSNAASVGNLEMLKWAREHKCPWAHDTTMNAAQYGHWEILEWAHKGGCESTADVCTIIAFRGDLQRLQWARAQGFPWSEDTTTASVDAGHQEVLEYLYENECPRDERMWKTRIPTAPSKPVDR